MGITTTAAICSIVVIGVILTPFLVGFSFKVVNRNNWGIRYSTTAQTIDRSQIYDPGSYYVGLGYDFISYPSTYTQVTFSADPNSDADVVTARTQDGLLLSLDISYQYQLIKEQLLNVLDDFGSDYNPFFIAFSRGSIRDTASTFTTSDFFYNRTYVGQTMHQGLAQVLLVKHANLEGFQLRDILYPDAIDTKFNTIQTTVLDKQQALSEHDPAIIRQNTTNELNILQATNEQAVKQINAQSDQLVALITANTTYNTEITAAQTALARAPIDAQTQLIIANNNATITIVNANASAAAYSINQQAIVSGFSLQQNANIIAFNNTAIAQIQSYASAAQVIGLNSTDIVNYKFLDVF